LNRKDAKSAKKKRRNNLRDVFAIFAFFAFFAVQKMLLSGMRSVEPLDSRRHLANAFRQYSELITLRGKPLRLRSNKPRVRRDGFFEATAAALRLGLEVAAEGGHEIGAKGGDLLFEL